MIFAWLLARPKLIAGVLIVALLAGGAVWYGHKRFNAGYSSGQRAQLDTDNKQFAQVRAGFQSALDSAEAKIQTMDQKLAALDAEYRVLNLQYTSLQAQRKVKQVEVAKLPDNEVKQDLETKLGGSLDDITILRKDDSIVTDYPLLLESVANLTSSVANLNDSVTQLNAKVDAVASERDQAIQFGNEVVGYYTKAYNASQIHHSLFLKIITLGIVRDKHMNLPSPITLKH